MPRISKVFKLAATQGELDFVDITTDRDTRLFLEPFAISLRDDAWSGHCQDHIVSFFDAVIQAIRSGHDDRARNLLNYLSEPDETGLGYSTKRWRGRGVRGEKARRLFLALKRSPAVQTGLLQDLGETDLFVEGISRDGLSDITASVLRGPLIDYTQAQCANWGVALRKDVAVGHVWDPSQQQWHARYADLPVAQGRHIILVPKFSVRRALLLNSQEYYSNYIIDFIREQELIRGSSLVHVLKSGARKVYKKDVKEKHPFSKDFLARFTSDNPHLLESYKRLYKQLPDADGVPRDSDIDKDFDEVVFAKALIEHLPRISAGVQYATVYHRFMIGALEFLLFPNLIYPTSEQKLHEGRKRIDILYTNAAKRGFFERELKSSRLKAQVIPIECKNYAKDPPNPELDQISSRLSDSRGWLGFMCYRGASDEKTVIRRCADTAADGRGVVIPISDNDLTHLFGLIASCKRDEIDAWLSARFVAISSHT